jgi:hypothetical protein
MKRLIYIFLAVLTLAGLSACRSYNFYTAAINKTDLSAYHTFAWVPGPGVNIKMGNDANTDQDNDEYKKSDQEEANEAADAEMRDVARDELMSKGLREDLDNPDLVVTYIANIGTGVRTNYYYGGGWGPYWGHGWGYGWGYGWRGGWGYPYYWGYPAYAEKEHYKEGTVIIDLIDAHTRKIVWRGYGVTEYKNAKRAFKDIPPVVQGILDQLQLKPSHVKES